MQNGAESPARRYHVGYAMAPKKVDSVFQESLIAHAASRAIDLVPVDLDKPLVEQGHFDCLLHKFYGQEWRKQLEEYAAKYPATVIMDPLEHVEKLHNRMTMLQDVSNLHDDLQLAEEDGSSERKMFPLGTPNQIIIGDDSLTEAAELKLPVIAKPLMANGSVDSHQMFLVLNKEGLDELKSRPVVLQEFINHGGVVFKVYVAGDHVRCVKRRSLPDISDEKLATTVENLIPFALISGVSTFDDRHDPSNYDNDAIMKLVEEAEMPPESFVDEVAQALRKALKLHLFNFDVIKEKKSDGDDANRYLVIDINYFPGYAKVPNYETMLVDFLLDIFHGRNNV